MASSHDEPRTKIPHTLLVTGSGQGHINPCKLLAGALAAVGFEVSFIFFSSVYTKLAAKERLIPELSDDGSGGGSGHTSVTTSRCLSTTKVGKGLIRIHVVEDDFAPGDADKLFFHTPAMQENLFNLILQFREQGNPLTCLVTDPIAAFWVRHVAVRVGMPLINFWTSTAISYLMSHYAPRLFSQGIFPEKGSPTQWKRETPLMLDLIPGLPPFSSELYSPKFRFADASSLLVSLVSEICLCVQHGERMLLHALSELEADAFQAVKMVGISAYAIGPLLHYAKKQEDSRESEVEAEESVLQLADARSDCIQWLDTQAESSVIYIAFGSEATISAEDIQELALGLEACGNSFLWVIRDNSCGGERLSQVLPNRFLERTSRNGMIINWAPQVEVLAHKAIGGFLTHCGWNSTLESLWEGVPMLCCPMQAEQMSNSHYICNVWGVGLERTDTGSIERRNVEVGVKGLMKEEEGLKARAKAEEVKEVARRTSQEGGQSFSNLQKFYEDMKELCSKE